MSLIEQAAKRLEELRRAGAELPAGADTLDGPGWGDAGTATDTVVRPLNPRPAEAFERERAEQRSPRGGRLATRTVELDLEALKSRGFVTPDMPRSQLADEFRVVKRPILRNATGRGAARVRNGNLVMVTSAVSGEGKTFTAVNLALSIALEYDNTVLLVDGDVTHPSLPAVLGIPPEPGLLDLLTRGDLDFADVLVRTSMPKLSLLPSGQRHKRATEVIASDQMASFVREVGSRYPDRIVVFDSPPLLGTTEARVLASHMGQIVMVVAADQTPQATVNQALATIDSCEVVLMLLNKAGRTDVGSYYGYYGDAPSP